MFFGTISKNVKASSRTSPPSPGDPFTRRRTQQARSAKRQFDKAHAEGMKALERGDYDALGKAVDDERRAVEEFVSATTPGKRRAAAPKRR